MNPSIADLSFVWPTSSLAAVSGLGSTTGCGVIIDCRGDDLGALGPAVRSAAVDDILVTWSQCTAPGAPDQMASIGATAVWVECGPSAGGGEVDAVATALAALRDRVPVVPVVSDLSLLECLVAGRRWPVVALKGHEASGFVSGETAHVLVSIADRARQRHGSETRIVIWGGLATPEAVAAFLSTGVQGVVCESVHWLTDAIGLDEGFRQALGSLRADATRVVGSDVGVPCRLFDKGNSRAVRALLQLLAAQGDEPAARRAVLVDRVAAASIPPLTSTLGADELVPLGPEAAFAAAFVERFGSGAAEALSSFRAAVLDLCASADARIRGALEGPVSREWGTTYPIVQGAMSWITDHPDFARRLADAGALPTVALGLRSRADLDRDVVPLTAALGERPYAVNVIVLPENPVRDEQLAWIEATRPPFVVIAAGDPSFARRLAEQGLRVLYIASDEGLLRVAIEAGVRWVILEGNEAGGHVGPHSLALVAQTMHELRRRQPALFDGVRLIMAGGIYDRQSAHRAILLGGDGVQMGTAYLATEDIVATGALSRLYQQAVCEAVPGGTMVLGEALGLRIRSLRSPKTERLARLERERGKTPADERELRHAVEAEATGTLLVAARGVRAPGGEVLDEAVCREEGQFMSGAVAGCLDGVRSLVALHDDVASAPVANRSDLQAPARSRAARVVHAGGVARPRERLAITGMAMANALGHTLDGIWGRVVAGDSGIVPVPADRWDHQAIYDPHPGTPGKTYSAVGAFLDLDVERQDIGVPPQDFRTMAQSTRLTLWLARRVVQASGLLESGIPPERIAVLIAQNAGEAASTLADLTITMSAPLLAQQVADALGLTPEQRALVEQRLCADRLRVDDTTLIGRLSCTAGGFVCNQYGFMGPSYAVTAACSTSLVALYNAVHLIRAGVIDAALVGGGEEWLLPAHYIEFAAVGALAGLSGRAHPASKASRPFDLERDGMVLGEGGAMIVIEREAVARRRHARIHAFIAGVGASNNIHGMVESLAATQQLAIGAAYADAGWAPETIDLVECHATSTSQGDVEEVRALKAFLPAGRGTALASFKSQIGHTLGASGLSSLIRGVLALEHRTLPPSMNHDTPDPAIDLAGWGFDVSAEPRDWPEPQGRPRRFEVNAFGFGGSNYVALLEEHTEDRGVVFVSTSGDADRTLLPADVSRHDLNGVLLVDAETPTLTLRGAVADPDPVVRDGAVARLLEPVEPPTADRAFVIARHGLFAADAAAAPLPLAFVFPGQGCQYLGMGRELAATFPVVREALERMEAVAGFDLLSLLFEGPEDRLKNTRWQQPALFALQFALAEFFRSCGVTPAAVGGHSLGEVTALAMAGALSWEDGLRLIIKRGQCMDDLSQSSAGGSGMLATDLPLDDLRQRLASRPSLVICNDNSPRQIVVGGDTAEVEDLQQELERAGRWVRRLRVSMAFHTPRSLPLVAQIQPLMEAIEIHPPRLPVLVNATNEPFPDDPDRIRDLVADNIVAPVRWRENVERLSRDYGIRVFLELGPKDVVSNLIGDTLPDAITIPTALPNAEVATIRGALARLAALGHVRSSATPLRLVVREEATPSGVAAGVPSTGPGTGRAEGTRGATRREVVEESPFVEAVIGLIMEATGYERHEISTDMDIRQDLSIRSSRLPVIMDAAERRFGIRIHLEELIEVRTVGDLAAALQKMVERGGEGPADAAAGQIAIQPAASHQQPGADQEAVRPRIPLRRFGWTEVPLPPVDAAPLALPKGCQVAVLGWNAPSTLTRDIRAWFGARCKAQTTDVVLSVDAVTAASPTALEAEVARHAAVLENAAVLVITLDGLAAHRAAVVPVVTAAFAAFQAFLRSANREGCLVLDCAGATDGSAVSEGLLGVLLSAAHETSSVLFRHATFEASAPLSDVLERCLDTGVSIVPLRFRGGQVLTPEVRPEPLPTHGERRFAIRRGDVVLVTGGARGITGPVASALAPFGPRLVLLGRSAPDAVSATAVDALRAVGLEAEYWVCDVGRVEDVAAVVDRAVQQHGRIDGLLHGAAVLRDRLIDYLSVQDFAEVMAVKAGGLQALYDAARPHGLRVVLGISSLAAVTGNAGQTSYAAASRAMAALIGDWAARDGVRGHTLWLPPVEGIGMASGAEIRDFLERRGLGDAYVDVDEIGTALAHELALAPSAHSDAVLVRIHPPVKTVRVQADLPAPDQAAAVVAGELSRFPLIDRVELLDRAHGLLVARRTFSVGRDLWLPDHRPIKELPHPLVSAIMLVEASLEAARLLHPHLEVVEITDADFLEMLACPVDGALAADIVCRATRGANAQTVCDVSVTAVKDPEQRPTATHAFRSFGCRIALGCDAWNAQAGAPWAAPGTFDTASRDRAALVTRYREKTGLSGRYLVLHRCDGTAPGLTRGLMINAEQVDFAGVEANHYQYSPYVLESLLQAAHFYFNMRDETDERTALPMRLGRLRMARRAAADEPLVVEARRTSESDAGTIWDVRSIDATNQVVMEVTGLVVKWFRG